MGIRQTRNIPNRIRYIFPLMFPHFYLIVPHNFCHRHILPAFHSHIPVSVLPLPEIAVQRLHAFLSVRRKRSAFPWAASGDTICTGEPPVSGKTGHGIGMSHRHPAVRDQTDPFGIPEFCISVVNSRFCQIIRHFLIFLQVILCGGRFIVGVFQIQHREQRYGR